VAKAVRLRKATTIVVAPNIEQIEAEGGLDDLLSSILTQAQAGGIPIVFALSRKKLGQVRGARAPRKGQNPPLFIWSPAAACKLMLQPAAISKEQQWKALQEVVGLLVPARCSVCGQGTC
jgi:ribosomal protein L7Ae-like RNA K-turn-binding protein